MQTCTPADRACDMAGVSASCRVPEESSDEFERGGIEAFPSSRIREMNRDGLVRLIRAARLPFLTTAIDERLALRDEETLVRLAMLAQRCLRNRMAPE